MLAGERQVAETVDGIRRDHVARYEFARDQIAGGMFNVLDVGCGVGYGSKIMAAQAGGVTAFDINTEAIEFARAHYADPRVRFISAEVGPWLEGASPYDVAVAFEIIEHVEDPRPLLKRLHRVAKHLIASVPNEEVFPWKNYKYHFRHYTRTQFRELLAECGWRVTMEWGQRGAESPVEPHVNGRTFVVTCDRDPSAAFDEDLRTAGAPETPKAAPVPASGDVSEAPATRAAAPERVVILGCGPSLTSYLHNARCAGGRRGLCDEVWGVNMLGDVLRLDRLFHMDDVRVQEIRAAAAPDSNIAEMVRWLKTYEGTVYTSAAHPGYPCLVDYPLQEVLEDVGLAYFNGTVPYAVAFAIHLGVKEITLYGCDFTYPDAHQAEKGRACLEFWLGYARARGIKVGASANSTLLDAREPPEARLYGYDAFTVTNELRDGRLKLSFAPRALPTAEEVERRYDHGRHPNSMVEEGG